jgi:IclR family acetate operon transcriptional repressor
MSHMMGRRSRIPGDPNVPGTKALHRALTILQAFTDAQPVWTLSGLSNELGYGKTTTHRILSALVDADLLSRAPGEREYQLGPELIVLGARALKAIDVREAAHHEMVSLARVSGETVTLASLVNDEILVLLEERGVSPLGLGAPVGSLWPAHATSAGKVLMAASDSPLSEPAGGLSAITDHTIVSWKEWEATLARVRVDEFATSFEELEYGYGGVAVPVKDQEGRTTAAMSIGGPLHRIGKERIPDLVDLLRTSAWRVSQRLGYRSELNHESS